VNRKQPKIESVVDGTWSHGIVVPGEWGKARVVWISGLKRSYHRGLSSRMYHTSSGQQRFSLPRVVQFGNAVQNRWCASAKAKYCFETDSEQVVWTKDEKNFEKRVKSTWNRWAPRVWEPCHPALWAGNDRMGWLLPVVCRALHFGVASARPIRWVSRLIACFAQVSKCGVGLREQQLLRRWFSRELATRTMLDARWALPITEWSHTTRLETRTKESTECASVMVSNQSPSGAVDA